MAKTFLRYGDAIILEVIGESLLSCDSCTWVFGSESLQRAVERLTLNVRLNETRNLFVTHGAASMLSKESSSEFFSYFIIEIHGGPGDEAPGEVIKYGGQISLCLRRNEMFFCANRNSKNVLLFNASELKNFGREFIFKIMPKYKYKTYGECVQYDDEVMLMDFLGRPVCCEDSASTSVGYNANAATPTTFRLRTFSPSEANVGASPILQLGQVVRLQHVESGHLLNVQSHKVFDDEPTEEIHTNTQLDVYAYEGVSDSCSALWELCTTLTDESKDLFSLDSKIGSHSPLRLRQVLSQRYLAFNENGSPELSLIDHNGCEIQLQEVVTGRPAVDGAFSQQTKVTIYHRSSGLYVSLDHGQLSLSTSSKGHVFQLSVTDAVDSALLRTVACAGSTLRSLQPQWEWTATAQPIYSQMAEFIGALLSKLFPSELGGMERELRTRRQFVQLALTHFQLPGLLSDIAHSAFLSLQSVLGSISADNTVDSIHLLPCVQTLSAVYSLLANMMSDFRPFAEQVLSAHQSRGFVSRLIQQQLYFDDLSSALPLPKPPLAELLSCSRLASEQKPLQLLDQTAISCLLDAVFDKIRQGKVPGEFPYRFLGQVCAESSADLQTSICRQVLGAASHSGRPSSSPFWSAMVYRTYLHCDEKSKTPDLSAAKGRPKIRLLISTSFFGQCRPTLLTGKVVAPVHNMQNGAPPNDEHWVRAIAERNSTSGLLLLPGASASPPQLQPQLQPSPRSSALLNDLSMRIEWKDLQQLSAQESKFYCASLELLASLCSGRNSRTQTIIRQLLPVDHILQALLIQGPNTSISLLSVQAGFARLLRDCYVDSAVLRPPSQSALDPDPTTAPMGKDNDERRWVEVFEEECYGKVLCQSSQLADGLFEVADDMTDNERQAAVRLIRWPCYSGLYSHGSSELLSVDVLRALRDARRGALAAENVRSVEQRALLLSIIASFVSTVPSLWNTEVEQGLWKLFLQQRDAIRNPIQRDEERVDMDFGQQLLAAKISYVQEMTALTCSLLLRRFFDDDYNCNPTYSPEIGAYKDSSDAETKSRELGSESRKLFYDLDALGDGFVVRDIIDCCDRKVRVVRYKADHGEDMAGFLRSLVQKMFAVLKAFPVEDGHQSTAHFFAWRFHYNGNSNAIALAPTLCRGAVEVKLLCCRVLHLCMDRYFSFTLKILRTVIYEPVMKIAISEKQHSSDSNAEDHVAKKFQQWIWKKLEAAKSNRNLLWTVLEYFREESFLTLLHLMYFNDNRLRQQVMSLIFRTNAVRSELANHIIDNLTVAQAHTTKKKESNILVAVEEIIFDKISSLRRLLLDLLPDENSDRQHHILPQYLNILDRGGSAEEVHDLKLLALLAIKKLLFQKSTSTVNDDTINEVVFRKRGLIETCSMLSDTPKAEHQVVKEGEISSTLSALYTILHEDISTTSTHRIDSVYRHVLNAAGFGQLLLSVLYEHGHRYVQLMAGGASKGKEKNASRAVELEAISLCCNLYRMVLLDAQKGAILPSGSNGSLPQLLLLLGPYCKEALYLLIDVVSLYPLALRWSSGVNFDALLARLGAHIRETYSQNEDREDKSSRTVDIASTLCIITLYTSPSNSSQIIQRLINTLQNETEDCPSLMSLALQLGFGTVDLKDLSNYAANQSKGGYAFNDDPVVRSTPGEVGPVRFMCNRYLLETDRATFWRSPVDILSDPSVDGASAVQWQSLFRSAKLLPPRSKLSLHLKLVCWLGKMSAMNSDIRELGRRFFDSLPVVVNVMFIDQIEIRFAYVVLLRGLWLCDPDNTGEYVINANAEWGALSVEQGKALIYTFSQDLRIFHFLSSERKEGDSESNDVQFKKHMHVYERYIEFGLLPCLSSLLSLATRDNASERSRLQELFGSIVILKAMKQLIDQHTARCTSIKPGLLAVLDKTRTCIQRWCADVMADSSIQGAQAPIKSAAMKFSRIATLKTFSKHRHFSIRRTEGQSDEEFMERGRSIFLIAVDNFSQEFGYYTDHLVALKEATVVHIDGRELVWDERSQLKVPRSSLIRDPLNYKSFTFTSQILSKHIFSYCRVKFLNRFADLDKEVAYAHVLSDFHLEFWADSNLTHRSRAEAGGAISLFHNSAFLKWAEHGGLLVKVILEHVQQHIESNHSGGNSRERSLLLRSNGYWMDVFCKGVLRTFLQDIYNTEDMTEIVRAVLVATERSRLRLLQDTLRSFGAVTLAVHHWLQSAVADAQSDATMMYYGGIALSWGVALLETGNTDIQVSFVDALRAAEKDFMRTFLSFLRMCRRHLSLEAQRGGASVDHHATVEMGMTVTIRLFRFLSLLCEGNNSIAQLFLLDSGVVVEVAMFVEEVSAVLSHSLGSMLKSRSVPANEGSDNDDDKEEGSAVKVIQWLNSEGELNFELNEFSQLIEVVQQGFDTLTEFCQGFLFQNQVAITSAGAIKHLGGLIQFCGSFQYLCVEETSNLNNVDNDIRKGLQTFFTHEASVKAPSGDLSTSLSLRTVLPVCGSDPLTLALQYPDMYEMIDDNGDPLVQRLCSSKKRFMDHQGGIDPLSVREMDENPYNIISNKLGHALWQLESSSILLLQSLSEGSMVDGDVKHCSAILESLPQETILDNMRNYWRRFKYYRLDSRYPNPGRLGQHSCYERSMALSYYMLCRRLCDMPFIDTSAIVKGSKRIFKELNVHPEKHVARIEVREPSDTGISVSYFPIPLLVQQNWQNNFIAQLRAELLFPLDESSAESRLLNSAEDKMKQFLREGAYLVDSLRYMQTLQEVSRRMPLVFPIIVVARRADRVSLLIIALTIGLNILMILSVRDDDNGTISVGGNTIYSTLMRYVGIVHLATCALAFCCFVLLYIQRLRFVLSRSNRKRSSSKNILSMEKKAVVSFSKTLLEPGMVLLRLLLPVLQPTSLVVFSALGVFHSPLWFSLCFSEMVFKSRPMQRLLRAVYLRLELLFALGIIALLLAYSFAVGAYSSNRINGGQDLCKTLSECALGAVRIGLYLDQLQLNLTAEDTLFSFAFVLILQAVAPALLVAVMAESFWSLQTQQRVLERQVQSSCFICSLKRDDLEYPGSASFAKHTTGEHNMWQYLWFIVYLEEKDPTQLSGVELFCKSNIHSARWLPTRMARRLQPMCMPSSQLNAGSDGSGGRSSHDIVSKKVPPLMKGPKDKRVLGGLHEVMKPNVKISPEIRNP